MSRYLRVRDLEEAELAEVDRLAHKRYGCDESKWRHDQRQSYIEAIAAIHAEHRRYHREYKEAA